MLQYCGVIFEPGRWDVRSCLGVNRFIVLLESDLREMIIVIDRRPKWSGSM